MQRVKEELQDIAKTVEETANIHTTYAGQQAFKELASRIREAGSLITYGDRREDAMKNALEAYEDFTNLVNEGVFISGNGTESSGGSSS